MALHWALSGMSMSVLYWRALNLTQDFRCGLTSGYVWIWILVRGALNSKHWSSWGLFFGSQLSLEPVVFVVLWAQAIEAVSSEPVMLVLTHELQGHLLFLLSYLPAGAAHMGRRADSCCCWTKKPWGAATKAGTGTGRTWDWHPGKGAQHHHPPAVSGEASGQETHGEVQEEPAQVKGWQSYQLAFRLVMC